MDIGIEAELLIVVEIRPTVMIAKHCKVIAIATSYTTNFLLAIADRLSNWFIGLN
jgi:hypothetical protein